MTRFQVHGVLLVLVKAMTLTACKTEIFFHYFFCRTSVAMVQDFLTLHPNTFLFFKGSLLQEWNSSKFLWHHFLECHCQLQCWGILSASWRVITLVLRDRACVSRSSGAGKMVKDIVEIISAWNISTLDLISPTPLQAQWKKHLLKRKIDYFEFSALSSYSQLLGTPEVDEARMQEEGIHWQFLISWQQTFHIYIFEVKQWLTVPWKILAYKWSKKVSVLAMLSCCFCQQLWGLQASFIYTFYWWIR